jgi:Tyrosine phosphatase family
VSSSKKVRVAILGVLLAFLVGFACWAYYPTFTTPGIPLVFKIEGALDSKINFRDAGKSINECAGTKLLPENILFRASGFFSGWSCDNVGNPDVIYSLNFSDRENRRYFCRDASGFNIGVSYQHIELSDIEFLSNWEQSSEQVKHVCHFLKDGIENLKLKKKTLYQCDAGRDRTGAVIALLAAYELESAGIITDQQIAAIECDYRKSKSLKPEKYGRIAKLLKELRSRGGVRRFLNERCSVF